MGGAQRGGTISRVAKGISKLAQFLTIEIWRIQRSELSRWRWYLIRLLKILVIAIRGLAEDKIQLRASALTYNTLLSVVPLIAVIFGVAKGFGLERALEGYLLERFPMHEEVVSRVISFSRSLLESVKGGVIAGIGVLTLFFTVIRVLANIERSFNDIWGVERSRSWGRKISDYLSVMLISPFILITSSTLTIIISGQVREFIGKINLLAFLTPAIGWGLQFIPIVMLWLLFSYIYAFLPNTRVRISSAVTGGGVAAILFHFFQLAYINAQILITRYNAIYGSFAALPLFLLWLQASWLIVLLGAELSFAAQNVEVYELKGISRRVSHSLKRLLCLRIAHLVIKQFLRQEGKPLNDLEIAQILDIPLALTKTCIRELQLARVISVVTSEDEGNFGYVPARDPAIFTIQYVIDSLEQIGDSDFKFVKTKEGKKIAACLDNIRRIVSKSPANKRLLDI